MLDGQIEKLLSSALRSGLGFVKLILVNVSIADWLRSIAFVVLIPTVLFPILRIPRSDVFVVKFTWRVRLILVAVVALTKTTNPGACVLLITVLNASVSRIDSPKTVLNVILYNA